jgi:hypothetical protein
VSCEQGILERRWLRTQTRVCSKAQENKFYNAKQLYTPTCIQVISLDCFGISGV